MLITDKWLVGGKPPPGYSFPLERLTILPLINDRYDIPLPRLRLVDRAVEQADVIHIVGYASPMVPLVCAAARRRRKPWVVCTAGLLPLRGRSLPLKRAFQAVWGNRILREAARLIAITQDERATISRYASSPEKAMLLPNAVDIPALSPEAAGEKAASRASPYLLFLGGFHPTKGGDLLVEAFATLARNELAGYVLVLAGGYETGREAIEALVRRLGVAERVRFAGWLSAREKEELLSNASFVVIPSRLDAMTMVVLEAAVAGRPVLMTSGCGFPDVEDCGGGRIVEPTVSGLASGLAAMVSSRDHWPEMGRRMQVLARDRYSWDAVMPRYLELFRDVVRETRRS